MFGISIGIWMGRFDSAGPPPGPIFWVNRNGDFFVDRNGDFFIKG